MHGKRGRASSQVAFVVAIAGLSCPACIVVDAVPAVGTVVASAFGAYTPTNSIEQIYYLGVYDPLEQLPPAVYRVRVRGQSSAMSSMKFGSGWVKSNLIDALETTATIPVESTVDPTTGPKITGTADANSITTGRRMVLFGPEGFRDVPRDHRLVVVMGASPEAFFQAMDQSLQAFNDAKFEKVDGALKQTLLQEMARVQDEQLALARLSCDANAEAAR